MQFRTERVVIETATHRITGDLTLPSDGYRSRMSDFLNSSELEFVSLTDVTLEPLEPASVPFDRDYVAVSRQHIVLAMPAAAK